MDIFDIHGHVEIICHILERNDVLRGVIIYIDVQREDIQDASHGVVRVTSINVNTEVFSHKSNRIQLLLTAPPLLPFARHLSICARFVPELFGVLSHMGSGH